LCHPDKVSDFQDIIKDLGYPHLKTGKVKLSLADMKHVQDKLGIDSSRRPFLEIIYQYSGHIINVPPGWAHMVHNLNVSFTLSYFVIGYYSQI
jgi:hypothetical protein